MKKHTLAILVALAIGAFALAGCNNAATAEDMRPQEGDYAAEPQRPPGR